MLYARTSILLLALGALAVLVALTPSALADADTLSHIAVGRWIAAHGVPRTDPFTFPRPQATWSNPEWLGDLAWYGLWRLGGTTALQAVKLTLLGLAGFLVARVGIALRATLPVLLLLLIACLPAAASTLTTRNHIHAYWLLPLFALVVLAQERRPSLWLTLIPLGWVWANVHGSVVLGWALVASLIAGRALAREPVNWRFALPALLSQPLLPLLGPAGPALYRQLWDHAVGVGVYRSLLIEWQSPLQSAAWVGVLPLHAFTLALVFVLPSLLPERRLWGPLGGAVLGLAMAYASRRFLGLPAVLGAAVVAAGWRGASATWIPRVRLAVAVAAVAVVFAYAGFAVAVTRARPRPDAREKMHGPQGAAEFVARFAPEGARLFNSYNDGPWLVWTTAPRVRHAVDPRNNLGSSFVEDYRELLGQPARFDREAAALSMTLAMLDLDDALFGPLIVHLDLSGDWTPVYLDGHRVVYARSVTDNQRLINEFGYRLLRARVSAQDLSNLSDAAASALANDLLRLGRTAPQLSETVTACIPVVAAAAGDRIPPAAAKLAATRLEEALADQVHLSGVLTACFARAVERLRGASDARAILLDMQPELGGDATFRAMARALAGDPLPAH